MRNLFSATGARSPRSWGSLVLVSLLCVSLAGCTLFGKGGLFDGNSDLGRIESRNTIAILPTVSTAAACDYCAADFKFEPNITSEDSLLASSFFYEQIGGHPRFLVLDHRIARAYAGKSHREAVADLYATQKIEIVLVSALGRISQRGGGPVAPDSAAAVRLWAAAINAETGALIWQDTFDRSDETVGGMRARWNRLSKGIEQKWISGGELTGRAAAELVVSMSKAVRH
jgi:hypothetical protein